MEEFSVYLVKRVEHCWGAARSLWGFQVTLSASSIPSSKCLYFREMRAPPPQAASTWSHILYSRQISAMGLIGSKAPITVVPEVAETIIGTAPPSSTRFTCFLRSSGHIFPRSSTLTQHTFSKTIKIN